MNTRKQEEMLTFSKMLDEKLKPVIERLNNIEQNLGHTLDELEKIPILEEKLSDQEKELQNVKTEMKKLSQQNHDLQEKIIKQETYSRKNNLRVHGISTSHGKSLEHTLIETFAKASVSITPADIERAHPINQRAQKGVVLVRFVSCKPRLARIGIVVHDDLPIEVVKRRGLLLPIFLKAKDLYPQMNPKLQLDKPIVGGKIYTQDNIHSISMPELLPEAVFTPSQHGVQAFYTKHSPLSNHYPCEFQLDGKTFTSAEQCLMYKKAMLFGDQHIADKILQTQDPAEAKSLGRSVSGFNKDTWIKNGQDYMFQAMTAKFSQNDKLKAFLKATKRNALVEASPSDKFWGCGLSLKNKDVFNKDKWTGANTAGKTLEHVRLNLC